MTLTEAIENMQSAAEDAQRAAEDAEQYGMKLIRDYGKATVRIKELESKLEACRDSLSEHMGMVRQLHKQNAALVEALDDLYEWSGYVVGDTSMATRAWFEDKLMERIGDLLAKHRAESAGGKENDE